MEQFALLCGSKICGGEIESPKANDVSDKITGRTCKTLKLMTYDLRDTVDRDRRLPHFNTEKN